MLMDHVMSMFENPLLRRTRLAKYHFKFLATMRKIMFNDKYGLTRAVLMGHKTMTRRILPPDAQRMMCGVDPFRGVKVMHKYTYCCVPELAIAQSYKDINWTGHGATGPGWNNKMFVCADYMPHRIKMKSTSLERLQDISEDDVLREGFTKVLVNNGWGNMASHWEYHLIYDDPKTGRTKVIGGPDYKEAFGMLIDKISGAGTWASNPWVAVYSFKLV